MGHAHSAKTRELKRYELIKDEGRTVFNNVFTTTCCAIGPGYSWEIDPITSHLKLL
jgi:PTH2 family peptidyl-tRNA hydrolase